MRLDLSTKQVLVTGGGGFLGSHLVERLRQIGCERITAPRRRDYDLIRSEAVERLFEECKPQVVIHAAAVVGGIGANRNNPGSFFFENALMGIQVIDACRRFGVEKTVVLGTICAYPKFTPVPFRRSPLGWLSRRNQCSVRDCEEGSTGPVPGVSRAIRNERHLLAASKFIWAPRQLSFGHFPCDSGINSEVC